MAFAFSDSRFASLPIVTPPEPRMSDGDRQLVAEVEDLRRIHALSLRLATAHTLSEVLADVLQTAAGLARAPLGSVQVMTPSGELGMVDQVGFGNSIVDEFRLVRLEDCTTCSTALKRRSRVAVRNMRTDPNFTEIASALHAYGAVAAVSTPVLDSGRNVLAMLSLYWREEHVPDERELRVLDLCADLAGRHVERSAAEARQALLMRELAHRGKNLLAVVQAIATRTLRGERTLDDARKALGGRLQALAKSYDALTDEAVASAQIEDVMAAGLESFGEHVVMRGPAISVPAKTAQTLSLVVHELATNAVKYGALTVASGRIEIEWKITGDPGAERRFSLAWLESGGPAAMPPARKGFGSVILTTIVGAELKCAPALEYAPQGFRYRLECALNALTGSKA